MSIANKLSKTIEQQKNKFDSSKTGSTVTKCLEKEFRLKDLLPILKWVGISAGVFIADAAILGALSDGIVKSVSNAVASVKGIPSSDLVDPGWFLTHPFQAAWIFFRHIMGTPINVTAVFNTWIGLNAACALGFAARVVHKKYAMLKAKRTEAGTSEFVEPEKVKNIFSYSYGPGIMFGGIGSNIAKLKPVILRPDVKSNLNVAVFGPPGTGKSAGYIKNNIMQAVINGWSIVVTDTKGEMVKEYAVWLEKKGHVVKIFNLKDMLNSDRWNPLLEVHDGISAQDFCNVVIASTSAPARKGGDQDFWKTAELNLLKALTLYVINELPPNQRNLGVLYLMLASGDSKQLDQIFSNLLPDHPAKLPYNLFVESSGTVRTGVIMGLGNRLGVFQEKLVRELTAVYDKNETIDLTLPGKQKCAYFCVVPDSRSTFDFLASLFFSFFFMDLMDLADSNESGRLDVPVNFLLDEFCNIPGIPDFTKKLSTMRSRGIACSIIFQNIPQLEQCYPNKMWEIILGDCDYWLLLGSKELDTSKYMSDIIGPSTIEIAQETRPKGLKGINPFEGHVRTGPTKRMLMDPSEVGRLNPDEALLRISDGRMLSLKKMLYIYHPYASELEERHISKYRPPWAKDYARREGLPGWGNEQESMPDQQAELKDIYKSYQEGSENEQIGSHDGFWG